MREDDNHFGYIHRDRFRHRPTSGEGGVSLGKFIPDSDTGILVGEEENTFF
jgi:hypothetical protein